MVANGGAEDGAAAAARRQQAMRSLEHAMHRSPGNNPMRSHNARIAAALGYLSAPRPTAVLPPAKNRRYDFQRVMKGEGADACYVGMANTVGSAACGVARWSHARTPGLRGPVAHGPDRFALSDLRSHFYSTAAPPVGSYTPRARTGRSGLEGATSPRMRSPRKRFDVTDARCHMWSPHAKQEQAQAQADAPRSLLLPLITASPRR